jgi:fatty acid desaturase
MERDGLALELWTLTAAFVIGGAIGWIFMGLVWPWLGPYLLRPTPLPTVAGVWAYSGYLAMHTTVRSANRHDRRGKRS